MGRCSALVALPVLALAGLRCALLPTALFSTHTGGFGEVHRRDLGADTAATLGHWRRLGLSFDAVYVGYTADAAQLRLVEDALPWLMAPGARLFVDPVMGDNGKRYAFCGEGLVAGFRQLCARADVIFPNRTESALLLDLPLTPGAEPAPPQAGSLLSLGAKAVVLTGVLDGKGGIGVRAENAGSPPYSTFRERMGGSWPGTGDLLASCVIAAVLLGADLHLACGIACDLLDESLRRTVFSGGEPRHGLAFEPSLPGLARAFQGIAAPGT